MFPRAIRTGAPLILVAGAIAAAMPLNTARAEPVISSWKLNTTGLTGYNSLPADVQRVRYSDGSVYVNASSIPDYSIGPWPGNPNVPTNQGFLVRFSRSPVENTGTKTATPLGVIGLWRNGVAVFNALDAHSYLNQNIWHQNAITVEGPSFDACLGHPAPGGAYHHHENASCLYGANPAVHSEVLGYAFDGFPIYGPYAYADTGGAGPITRMRSSYALRNITVRHTLPDGTVLSPSQYGPDVSSTHPLGYYVEDYEYLAGSGDLDQYNGRFAVTPDYSKGTYAYYTTVDASGISVYPYHVGPQYYGVVATDDLTSHAHVTIGETVTDYDPNVAVGAGPMSPWQLRPSRPNPARDLAHLAFTLPAPGCVRLTLHDVTGRQVVVVSNGFQAAGAHEFTVDTAALPAGIYYSRLTTAARSESRPLLVIH